MGYSILEHTQPLLFCTGLTLSDACLCAREYLYLSTRLTYQRTALAGKERKTTLPTSLERVMSSTICEHTPDLFDTLAEFHVLCNVIIRQAQRCLCPIVTATDKHGDPSYSIFRCFGSCTFSL